MSKPEGRTQTKHPQDVTPGETIQVNWREAIVTSVVVLNRRKPIKYNSGPYGTTVPVYWVYVEFKWTGEDEDQPRSTVAVRMDKYVMVRRPVDH